MSETLPMNVRKLAEATAEIRDTLVHIVDAVSGAFELLDGDGPVDGEPARLAERRFAAYRLALAKRDGDLLIDRLAHDWRIFTVQGAQ